MEAKIGSKQMLSIEKTNEPYLSRKEVAKMLKISLPTLNEWSKQGILQSYKKGNRVLYKTSEIEEAVNQGAFRKCKRVLK